MNPAQTISIEDISPSATLAQKIDWLILHMWPASAPPAKNNVEIAAAITRATGEDISSTTVWKLRTGRQDNPQLRTLTAIATFFSVPLGYFGSPIETAPIEEDLTVEALRRALADGTIRHEVLHAFLAVPPDVRWLIDAMLITAGDNRARP